MSVQRSSPPPAPTPAAPPSSPTRERIVAAALRLFSEAGTGAASMRDLAGAAGVTVPGLYYHFPSKNELIRAVFAARGFGRMLEPSDEASLPGRIEKRVAEQCRRELARFRDNIEFLRLMHLESVKGDTAARDIGDELYDVWSRRWEVVLAGATDVDPRADLAAAAHVIRSALWGLFVEYLATRDESVTERIDELATLVGRGLAARRSRGR